MKQARTRRLVELGKDVLIVLLTCSALWLAAQSPLLGPLRERLREDPPQTSAGHSQAGEHLGSALPMAMAVNLPGGDRGGARYGILYDQAACQSLFQRLAGPLVEALSSAGTPQSITRTQWEGVLSSAVGVYLDFQGEVPLKVLMDWLSGEECPLDGVVRRLMLAVWRDGTALYYQDQATGAYYRCPSEVVDPLALADTLSGLTGNGAFFAFESELYRELDPDTLLPQDFPAPALCAAANSAAGGLGTLEAIVQDLGFSLNSTSFYAADERVARSGDDSVRLSDRGVLFYQAGEGARRYPVSVQGGFPGLRDSVEVCRQLAAAVLGPRCGEARVYLISANRLDTGWEIDFGYSLNGIPIHLDQGYAARFLVEGDQVSQFTLRLRSYTASGPGPAPLPPRQAAAALAAGGGAGKELVLAYLDGGGDTLSAVWAAREG